jgi:DNA transformation protein
VADSDVGIRGGTGNPIPELDRSLIRRWLTKLADLPNLGPKSVRMLAAAGINTRQQLSELGPTNTYLAVRQAGQNPSLNLLWALAAGLQNRHWTDLDAAEKDRLRAELQRLTQ